MGKKAKEHRRKVAARNQRIAMAKKMYQKEISKQFEEIRKQIEEASGNTENNEVEVLNENVDIESNTNDSVVIDTEETLPEQEG
jgi:hypothetical protein